MGIKRYGLILVVGVLLTVGVCVEVHRAIAAYATLGTEAVQDALTHERIPGSAASRRQ